MSSKLRLDHRTATELRPMASSQSILSRSDGSANFNFGEIQVMANVAGPIEVRLRDELVDKATLEVNVRPLRSAAGPASKSFEHLLHTLLSPLLLLSAHPRSLIQLNLQTTSAPTTLYSTPLSTDLADHSTRTKSKGAGGGTSERATGINAAVLALVDAGLEMRGMITAVAIAFLDPTEGGMMVDPTIAEEERAISCHLFGFAFGVEYAGKHGVCVLVESVGKLNENQLFEAQDLAQDACRGILDFIRKSVERKYGVGATAAPRQSLAKAEESDEAMDE